MRNNICIAAVMLSVFMIPNTAALTCNKVDFSAQDFPEASMVIAEVITIGKSMEQFHNSRRDKGCTPEVPLCASDNFDLDESPRFYRRQFVLSHAALHDSVC